MVKPKTPNELFLAGALKRSECENFVSCWDCEVKLTPEFCEAHCLDFDWRAMANIFLDNEYLMQEFQYAHEEMLSLLFSMRESKDPERYQHEYLDCQLDLAIEFSRLLEIQNQKRLSLWTKFKLFLTDFLYPANDKI